MGMFSWKCKGCGAEICEPELAVVTYEGPQGFPIILCGEYDGYGRFMDDTWNWENHDEEPAMWHKKCYMDAPDSGQESHVPSDHAPNQGFGDAQEQFLSQERLKSLHS
jgi:hypothetical protein